MKKYVYRKYKESYPRLFENAKRTPIKQGYSGQKHILEYGGKKYILQECPSKKFADDYSMFYKKLGKYGFFPKFYFQDGKNLLWEYISGRDCNKKDANKVSYEVGRICAFVNRIPKTHDYDIENRLMKNMNAIKESGVINNKEYSAMKEKFYGYLKKLKPKVVMDANDVYPENFRLSGGKVYFVDIEAIKPIVKGQGIGKSFNRWFITNGQRKKFIEGYASVNSVKYLTKEYLEFLEFYFLVRSIGIKKILKQEVKKKDIDRLREII